jgi:MFS family permease
MQACFQTTHHQIQFTLTIYFLIFGIVQLIYGPLSDRFGRKPIFLLSLSIYTIASLLCALAVTMPMLILARSLQALGAGSAISGCNDPWIYSPYFWLKPLLWINPKIDLKRNFTQNDIGS